MTTTYMYDKIIDVEFSRSSKPVVAPHKVCNPKTFRETTVHNLRVWQAGQGENILEFYKGNYREVIVERQSRNGEWIRKYKKMYAHGTPIVVRTLEDMKRGVTPQGIPFKSGDLIRIAEDNSLWNVYIAGAAESFYTETTYEVPETIFTIQCPLYGKKPTISLEVSLIPGQNCYAAVLRITNLNMNPVEIRTWDRMRITAGYANGHKVILDCPIFSSYIESPNPDGVTVFEGLTVGMVEDVLIDRYFIIDFIQEHMTVGDFIHDVSKGISHNIECNLAIGKYEKDELIITRQKVYTQNGMAVLAWLQEVLSDYIKARTLGQDDIFVQLHNGILDVILLSGEDHIPDDAQNAISLDMVSSASFAGASLNVIAPWNPELQPGKLFYMSPYFYNGSRLPNSLRTDAFKTPSNLYRVITMSVSFSTTDSSMNKMSVLALPAYNTEAHVHDISVEERSADTYARMEKAIYKIDNALTIGKTETGSLPNEENPDVETKTGKPFIDNGYKVLSSSLTWVTITQAEYTGAEIASIAAFYLKTMLGGPRLTDTTMYYKPSRADLRDEQNTLGLKYYQHSGVSAISIWVPLIALGTYWSRRQDIVEQRPTNWSEIRADNIQYVEDGMNVMVPQFPSGTWTAVINLLKPLKELYREAYESYSDTDPGMRSDWQTFYYYLGGTGGF